MERYPTINGIAVSPLELKLPQSRFGWEKRKHMNRHHFEYTEPKMARLAITLALRNLESLQLDMPVDVHRWIHNTYSNPQIPTEEQAARRIITDFEQGRKYAIRDNAAGKYVQHDIPKDFIDALVRRFPGAVMLDMAAD